MVTVSSAVEFSATISFPKSGPKDFTMSSVVQFNEVLNGVERKKADRTHQCSAVPFSRFPFTLPSAGMDAHNKSRAGLQPRFKLLPCQSRTHLYQ